MQASSLRCHLGNTPWAVFFFFFFYVGNGHKTTAPIYLMNWRKTKILSRFVMGTVQRHISNQQYNLTTMIS